MFRFTHCLMVALLWMLVQPVTFAQIGIPSGSDRQHTLPPGETANSKAEPAGNNVRDAVDRALSQRRRVGPVTRTRTVTETTFEEIPIEEQKRLEGFQAAIQELRKKHDSAEDRDRARAALETLVVEQMDRDLNTREEQLAEIEAQAARLREQLEQRKAAKSEFVKLIMMMIENPAAGFGLPSEWMSSIGPEQPSAPTDIFYGAHTLAPLETGSSPPDRARMAVPRSAFPADRRMFPSINGADLPKANNN